MKKGEQVRRDELLASLVGADAGALLSAWRGLTATCRRQVVNHLAGRAIASGLVSASGGHTPESPAALRIAERLLRGLGE